MVLPCSILVNAILKFRGLLELAFGLIGQRNMNIYVKTYIV